MWINYEDKIIKGVFAYSQHAYCVICILFQYSRIRMAYSYRVLHFSGGSLYVYIFRELSAHNIFWDCSPWYNK